ncbi:MAG: hypothetical protein CMP23_04770 [Rickettsiales bacterium]|nr:hypothetical protein [Rickettsiales bacterium]
MLGVVILIGALLQLTRLPFRWSPVALAYAAYFHEFRHAIELAGPLAAFSTFVGLHPPAYSLVFLTLMEYRATGLSWLACSALFSLVSIPLVWWTARQGVRLQGSVMLGPALLAGLVIAVSPHRNAYGLEVNNYPLLIGVTAAQLLCFARLFGESAGHNQLKGPAAWLNRDELLWLMVTALAIWTHLLSIALPCAQLLLVITLPETRQRTFRLLLLSSAVTAMCLPLSDELLRGIASAPINEAPGLTTALAAAVLELPGRYGSRYGAYLLIGLGLFGAARALRLKPFRRIVPLSWLMHLVVAAGLILTMVSRGTAAAHQFPYYLVLLPSGALLIGLNLAPGLGLRARRVAIALTLLALALHATDLGKEAHRGLQARSEAALNYGLIETALDSWTPGSSLLLHGFPDYMDDDKDGLDAAFQLVPWNQRIHFGQPKVETLVPGDPNWGQPLQFENQRWLYTFTSFEPSRVEAITTAMHAQGRRVVVAAYDTQRGAREAEELKTWASRYGEPGRRAQGQLLFILAPPTTGLPSR